MRNFSFTPTAFEQYNKWVDSDKKIRDKIVELLKDIARDPFKGIGKPEPLKHHYKGYWSRRITEEHRLIYEISENNIHIISCKYHY